MEEEKEKNSAENDLSIDSEAVSELTESEALVLIQKADVKIGMYEDILLRCKEENLDEAEAGFDREDYERLKKLEKLIYARLRKIGKESPETGFFGCLPVWAFAVLIICALFTIIPVNPYLAVSIWTRFKSETISLSVFYFIYFGFFLLTETVSLIALFLKRRKSGEKSRAFRSYLVLYIVNIVIAVPGLLVFLKASK